MLNSCQKVSFYVKLIDYEVVSIFIVVLVLVFIKTPYVLFLNSYSNSYPMRDVVLALVFFLYKNHSSRLMISIPKLSIYYGFIFKIHKNQFLYMSSEFEIIYFSIKISQYKITILI
jgi:hypothetical protein